MTVEELRKKDWIVFECLSGSHAYGTNIEGSDEDIRGVFILPTEEVLAGRYIEQVSDKLNDIVFYEIGRFLELIVEGNPNMIEMLNVPKDCIIGQSPAWNLYFPKEVKDKFLVKTLSNKFLGFANSQVKKAKGQNKKINWEKDKMARKTPLDFCYVMGEREESLKFHKWAEERWWDVLPASQAQDLIGLAKVNNMPDLYSMYVMENNGGFIDPKSNQVQLRSIPKGAEHLGYLRFDVNAYSTHCKDYKSYQKWLKERNPLRYEHNKEHGQGYDGKNLMHLIRILNMGEDLALGKGIVVRRPEAKYLISIRMGEVKLQDLYDTAEDSIKRVKELFKKSKLPGSFPMKMKQELLLKIRKDNLQ